MKWLTSLFARESEPAKSDAPLFFTNTLSGKKEAFSSRKAGEASLYSCGPTVYSKQHIGNLKAPIFADLVARVLTSSGYRVRRVMNITDVGHLVSNADEGEDKMEAGARLEGLSAQEIAARYTKAFLEDIKALNIDTDALSFPRATDYIKEQVAMVQTLEEKGYTYKTSDGVYFDTSRFPAYGALSHGGTAFREEAFAEIGRRIAGNDEKKHPADFALWKFSPHGSQRQQEWSSPWGMGFPGWHIECSAMAKALLGPELDIHTGGIDHIPVHHTNEIAQSESVNGRPLSRFWMHEAFINLGDEKIAKSTGNVIYLSDITERGYSPLALRYLFLQAHYRSPISFSWDALAAANEALGRLSRLTHKINVEARGSLKQSDASRQMIALLRDDLATPAALALLWQSVRDDDMEREEQLAVIDAAESVLGLSLLAPQDTLDVPAHIQALIDERELARKNGDFDKSDALRIHILEGGYHVEDGPSGTIVTRKPG